jgi:Kef-type K+ transport system membrane component KefB
MINIYLVAAFWFLSALISTVIANRLKISNALMEIIIGAIVGFLAFKSGFTEKLALDTDWMKFIAGVAAIMLTFLAGSELNPDSLKSKFKEITTVGLVGFFAPFIGATFIAYLILHWGLQSSLLTGIALSTTSMAVVYTVIPTLIANKFFLPSHLLEKPVLDDQMPDIIKRK